MQLKSCRISGEESAREATPFHSPGSAPALSRGSSGMLMQRVPSHVRSQFGRNFVSSLFHSFSLSRFPPPPLHKLNQDERTSFARSVLLLSFSWEEGEMDARCERQGGGRGIGRKEQGEGEPGEK